MEEDVGNTRLLNELHEEDVEWIFSEGVEQNVIANTVISEGEVPDSIFFVLQDWCADLRHQ